MHFLNLKEQPKLVLQFPEKEYILTRRLILASQEPEHNQKMAALSEDFQSGKIDYLEFAHLFFESVLSDYKREILDIMSVTDVTSLINAVRKLINSERELSFSEKKSE
jgi:hypothetical protein